MLALVRGERPQRPSGKKGTLCVTGFLALLFSCFVLLTSLCTTAEAAVTRYDDTIIDATVFRNGDMQITETVLFTSDEDDEVLLWPLHDTPYNAAATIEQVTLAFGDEVEDLREVPFNLAWRESPDHGPDYRCFAWDSFQKDLYLFGGFTAGVYSLSITYELDAAIQVYSDIAELYWRFAPTTDMPSAQSVELIVELPSSSEPLKPGDNVFAWIHGPENASVVIYEWVDVVTARIPALEGSKSAEIRIAFPASLMKDLDATSSNVHSYTNRLDQILKEENTYHDTSKAGILAALSVTAWSLLVVIVGLGWALIEFLRFRKGNSEESFTRARPFQVAGMAVVLIAFGLVLYMLINSWWPVFAALCVSAAIYGFGLFVERRD